MRKIGYLRVSTDEQRPDRQIDGLTAICDELHIETLSAVSKSRPVYEKVMRRLKRGDVFVVWDLDRAYRSARDALNAFSALQKRGVRFQVINLPVDVNTDYGYYFFTVMSAQCELERRMLSRRTKEGLAAARARGQTLGRPRKLGPEQIESARRRLASKQGTITGIAKEYDVRRWTLSRALKRNETA